MAGELESLHRTLARPYGPRMSVYVCVFQRVRPLLGGPVEEVPSLRQAEGRRARHRVSARADFVPHIIVFFQCGFFFPPS